MPSTNVLRRVDNRLPLLVSDHCAGQITARMQDNSNSTDSPATVAGNSTDSPATVAGNSTDSNSTDSPATVAGTSSALGDAGPSTSSGEFNNHICIYVLQFVARQSYVSKYYLYYSYIV